MVKRESGGASVVGEPQHAELHNNEGSPHRRLAIGVGSCEYGSSRVNREAKLKYLVADPLCEGPKEEVTAKVGSLE